jgi:hypothetical protein
MSWTHSHAWRGIRPWRRHSTVLMVAGFVYLSIGAVYLLTPDTPARAQALWLAFKWWDSTGWGIIFMLAGLLAMVSSRWPPVSKTWGYTVMTGLAGAWSGFYLTGIVFGHSPWGNLSSVALWGLVAFLWWAISGLINPEDGQAPHG